MIIKIKFKPTKFKHKCNKQNELIEVCSDAKIKKNGKRTVTNENNMSMY